MPFPLLFADNIGGLITLGILFISFLSWIVERIKSAQAEEPVKKLKRNDLLSEIQEFLEEIKEEPKSAPARQSEPAPRKQKKNKQKPKTLVERNEETGASITQHVTSYMQSDHLSKEVAKDMRHQVDAAVSKNLGVFTGASASQPTSNMNTVAAKMLPLLRDHDGVRQAFILSEILQKPHTLRQKS